MPSGGRVQRYFAPLTPASRQRTRVSPVLAQAGRQTPPDEPEPTTMKSKVLSSISFTVDVDALLVQEPVDVLRAALHAVAALLEAGESDRRIR